MGNGRLPTPPSRHAFPRASASRVLRSRFMLPLLYPHRVPARPGAFACSWALARAALFLSPDREPLPLGYSILNGKVFHLPSLAPASRAGPHRSFRPNPLPIQTITTFVPRRHHPSTFPTSLFPFPRGFSASPAPLEGKKLPSLFCQLLQVVIDPLDHPPSRLPLQVKDKVRASQVEGECRWSLRSAQVKGDAACFQ